MLYKNFCLCRCNRSYSLLPDLVISMWPYEFVREDYFPYHKLVREAQVSKSLTIFVHELIVASVVGSDLGIDIAHKYLQVFLSCFIKDYLQLLVKDTFLFIVSIFGWGVTLDVSGLILPFFVLNLTVFILGLTGFHLLRALCAFRDSISSTTSVWGPPSSVCPKYSSVFSVFSLICPSCYHLVLFCLREICCIASSHSPLVLFSLFHTLFWCSKTENQP